MNTKALEKAQEKARKKQAEWDFTNMAPHERPMAVAWEYGRELKDSFQKCLKKGVSRDRFISDVLHPVYLDFIHSPHWPKKPYQSLTQEQRRQAFPRAPWPLVIHKKDRSVSLLKEIPTFIGIQPSTVRIIKESLCPDNKYDPCKALIVVDLGRNSNATLREFQAYLHKKDLLLGPGRQAHEKDLRALGVLRLKLYFNGHKYTAAFVKEFPTLISKDNRRGYFRHAMARLGKTRTKQCGTLKPIFSFFRYSFSFDDDN
jgi:hypothetical protein